MPFLKISFSKAIALLILVTKHLLFSYVSVDSIILKSLSLLFFNLKAFFRDQFFEVITLPF